MFHDPAAAVVVVGRLEEPPPLTGEDRITLGNTDRSGFAAVRLGRRTGASAPASWTGA